MSQAKLYRFDNYELLSIPCGPVETNSFIVIDRKNSVCIIFDVPFQSFDIIDSYLEKERLRVKDIYLTHSHWDHFGDANLFRDKYKCSVYVSKIDEYRMLDPMSYIGFPMGIDIPVTKPDDYLETEGTLTALGIDFQVLHVPGHTEGSLCFVDRANKIVIAGDTLFKGSIGRTDLHGGDMATLLSSIREQLFTLPDDYTVLSGHGPATTIGFEKKYNQFVGDKRMEIGY
ncbi:MAG: MBL fold metallo-hydrolase [Candidatus Kapaibacteriales bacterium]